MAHKGNRKKTNVVRMSEGNAPLDKYEEVSVKQPFVGDAPKTLSSEEKKVWDEIIDFAWWLDIGARGTLERYSILHAEFRLLKTKFSASKHAQVRQLGSELGLDQGARLRLGINPKDAPDFGNQDKDDPEAFFAKTA